MTLYNMVNGFNPACIYFLPMLGKKPEEFPRFRDCFITHDDEIDVFLRVGGGNRNQGYGEQDLYKDAYFLRTYDDEDDNSYGHYIFKVPYEWQVTYNKILAGRLSEVPIEYINEVKRIYPELSEQGVIDKMFNRSAVAFSLQASGDAEK